MKGRIYVGMMSNEVESKWNRNGAVKSYKHQRRHESVPYTDINKTVYKQRAERGGQTTRSLLWQDAYMITPLAVQISD